MSLFGNWKLKTSTKFDEYMKEVGVNWALRKAGAACSSTTEITQVCFGIFKNEQFYGSQVMYTIMNESIRSLAECIRSFDLKTICFPICFPCHQDPFLISLHAYV